MQNFKMSFFRKSNMMGPNMVEESACSDAENAAAMDGFTTCTHNILMEVSYGWFYYLYPQYSHGGKLWMVLLPVHTIFSWR